MIIGRVGTTSSELMLGVVIAVICHTITLSDNENSIRSSSRARTVSVQENFDDQYLSRLGKSGRLTDLQLREFETTEQMENSVITRAKNIRTKLLTCMILVLR